MGPSSQQNQQFNALSNASSFATGTGEADITAGTNFLKDVLSGDATKTAQALAPQILAEKTSLQQDQKTNAMMGTRSGGTAAANVAAGDKVHSDITNLVGQLTGGAASGLTSVGTNLLGTGISGSATGFDEATKLQQQRAAKLNDIISSSAAVAGSVVGGLPGSPGGWQDITSNALAGAA